MKDHHHQLQLQTPQRDHHTAANRRFKSTPDIKPNQQRQIAKKSLNPDFTAVSEEESVTPESSKKIVSDHTPLSKSAENFDAWGNEVDISPSETVAILDLTSLASAATSENQHVIVVDATDSKCEILEAYSYKKTKSVELELLIKRLEEARIHVSKSKGLGHSSKILKTLINVIIEQVDGEREKKDWIGKLLAHKGNLVFLAFILGILVIFVVWFFNSGANGISTGLPPT